MDESVSMFLQQPLLALAAGICSGRTMASKVEVRSPGQPTAHSLSATAPSNKDRFTDAVCSMQSVQTFGRKVSISMLLLLT